MKNLLIRYLLYFCIAMVPACGTRKVATEKSSVTKKDQTDLAAEGNKSAYTAITTQDQALSVNNKTSQTVETGKFDKDTGKLVEGSRTAASSELIITRTIHTRDTIRHDVELWKMKVKTIHELRTVYKSKKTDTNRNGLYYLGGFGILVFGFLAWLKWIK